MDRSRFVFSALKFVILRQTASGVIEIVVKQSMESINRGGLFIAWFCSHFGGRGGFGRDMPQREFTVTERGVL